MFSCGRRCVLLSVMFIMGVGQGEAESIGPAAKASDQKSQNLLPGEQVTTSSGKKMKVWSTNGPVDVDRAPEPFEDKQKSLIDGNDLNIEIERGINGRYPAGHGWGEGRGK